MIQLLQVHRISLDGARSTRHRMSACANWPGVRGKSMGRCLTSKFTTNASASKAYELWDIAGRPRGQDLGFWLAAEKWVADVDEAG